MTSFVSNLTAMLCSSASWHSLLTVLQPGNSQAKVGAGWGGVGHCWMEGKLAAIVVITGEGLGCRPRGAGTKPPTEFRATIVRGFKSATMGCEGGAAGEEATEDMSVSIIMSTCMCSAVACKREAWAHYAAQVVRLSAKHYFWWFMFDTLPTENLQLK